MRNGILTLTTDFGPDGPYVAAMKGVILGLAPSAQMVDVCHRIAPQNILEGAFVLASILDAFPPGTVHLGVVDPGVGTDRRLIAVSVADQWVVAPDNGLVGGITLSHKPDGIWSIESPMIRRPVVSHTFHGRDILAPAAAHLLLGLDPDDLGPRLSKLVALANFEARVVDRGFLGEVIYRDTFGNLVTNIKGDQLGLDRLDDWCVEIAGERITGLAHTYGDRPSAPWSPWSEAPAGSKSPRSTAMPPRSLRAGSGTTVWIRRRERARTSTATPLAVLN